MKAENKIINILNYKYLIKLVIELIEKYKKKGRTAILQIKPKKEHQFKRRETKI